MMKIKMTHGFTLIEAVIVILVIGVLASVAIRQIGTTIDTAKYEQTKRELDHLANAIVGNPEIRSGGARTDFGYVGDNGVLPSTLDALAANPGLATWAGPYVAGGATATDFKTDGWGTAYYFADTMIRSTGSGSNIDKIFSVSSTELLNNTVAGQVINADGTMPGDLADSIRIQLLYPSGGSLIAASVSPDAAGSFTFGGVPIGNHALRLIYLPDDDTIAYPVTVYPGRTAVLQLTSPVDLW
jgi:prepilin-type N-terminal cleavage/methylation domain-containing protein